MPENKGAANMYITLSAPKFQATCAIGTKLTTGIFLRFGSEVETMQELDETDLEILAILGEDARRPYSEIGDEVGLSGPAVSDRVTRLQEAGVINHFTVDIDRSQLRAGIPVFVRVDVPTGELDEIEERIRTSDAVEHVFVTADGDAWFTARAEGHRVHRWLDGLFEEFEGVDYTVTLLDEVQWQPTLEGIEFALTCAECGNTVDSEGESTRIDGDIYHFCCPSCRNRFDERYQRFEAGT